MGTLGGHPNPPALWLRRAKPGSAYAISNGNPGRVSCALGTYPTHPCPRASRGLAQPSAPPATHHGSFGTCPPPTTPARCARALAARFARPRALWRSHDGSRPKAARGWAGWVGSPAPTSSAGKARLRLRGHGKEVAHLVRQGAQPLTRSQGGYWRRSDCFRHVLGFSVPSRTRLAMAGFLHTCAPSPKCGDR